MCIRDSINAEYMGIIKQRHNSERVVQSRKLLCSLTQLMASEMDSQSNFFLTEALGHQKDDTNPPTIQSAQSSVNPLLGHYMRSHFTPATRRSLASTAASGNTSLILRPAPKAMNLTSTAEKNSFSLMTSLNKDAYQLFQTINLDSPRTRKAMLLLGYTKADCTLKRYDQFVDGSFDPEEGQTQYIAHVQQVYTFWRLILRERSLLTAHESLGQNQRVRKAIRARESIVHSTDQALVSDNKRKLEKTLSPIRPDKKFDITRKFEIQIKNEFMRAAKKHRRIESEGANLLNEEIRARLKLKELEEKSKLYELNRMELLMKRKRDAHTVYERSKSTLMKTKELLSVSENEALQKRDQLLKSAERRWKLKEEQDQQRLQAYRKKELEYQERKLRVIFRKQREIEHHEHWVDRRLMYMKEEEKQVKERVSENLRDRRRNASDSLKYVSLVNSRHQEIEEEQKDQLVQKVVQKSFAGLARLIGRSSSVGSGRTLFSSKNSESVDASEFIKLPFEMRLKKINENRLRKEGEKKEREHAILQRIVRKSQTAQGLELEKKRLHFSKVEESKTRFQNHRTSYGKILKDWMHRCDHQVERDKMDQEKNDLLKEMDAFLVKERVQANKVFCMSIFKILQVADSSTKTRKGEDVCEY
eukprot:TRINITY_DN5375_c0_g1_i4.p1 TRINITY_DN5375_c0_g1~~TRINITY_DN5375_c0_g1_i4.p1  ORF type:complete len:645 (-),score=80.85 TRINITY_DN5375_c0_g1_i4:395-2329(-)